MGSLFNNGDRKKKDKKTKIYSILCLVKIPRKISVFKIAAQAFESGDFLNIFLRFLGFWGSFSNKKNCIDLGSQCTLTLFTMWFIFM